jgi:hypothetical protein
VKSLVVILVIALSWAAAQHWEFERVDTAPWGTFVRSARHPDGRLFLCYGDSGGAHLRIASRDSGWQYEELAAPLRGMFPAQASFAIGPTGALGVAYRDSGLALRFLEKKDSTWAAAAIPSATVYSVEAGYDSSGSPQTLHTEFSGGWWHLVRSRRPDSLWLQDTAASNQRHNPGDGCWVNAYAIAGGRVEAGLYTFVRSFPADFPVTGVEFYRVELSGGGWNRVLIAGGAECYAAGASLAAATGMVHSCYSVSWPGDDRFYYDGGEVDNEWTPTAALRVDATGRPHVARSADLTGAIRYQFYNGGWLGFDVGAATAGPLALEFDAAGEPLIAFANDSGVWLARGVEIVGTTEPRRPGAAHGTQWPTFARGSVQITAARGELLDISGRRVMELRPGPNDVSRLSPGVYFLGDGCPDAPGTAPRRLVVVR